MTGGASWRCRDGDWHALLGDDVAVLLPPEERVRAAAVWARVDDGAGFDDVLDALVSDGLRDLAAFVLVHQPGSGRTRVLVRGPAEVRLEGPGGLTTVTGDPTRVWVEESYGAVQSVSVMLPAGAGTGAGTGADEDAELRVRRGLVRVATVARSRADSGAEQPASALPEPERPEQRDPSGPPTEAMRAPDGPVARLLFSSGDVADVDRVVLVGRAPDAGRVRSGDAPSRVPLVVSVPSPQQEISATHLEVRPGSGPDLGLAVATDLGSTNGTVLTQPGLPPEDLKAGVGVPLVPGAVLELGDGLSIRVVEV